MSGTSTCKMKIVLHFLNYLIKDTDAEQQEHAYKKSDSIGLSSTIQQKNIQHIIDDYIYRRSLRMIL